MIHLCGCQSCQVQPHELTVDLCGFNRVFSLAATFDGMSPTRLGSEMKSVWIYVHSDHDVIWNHSCAASASRMTAARIA